MRRREHRSASGTVQSSEETELKKNLGGADRIMRIAIALGLFYWAMTPTGPMLGAGIAGVIVLITALVGWCPAYLPFGISTCKKQ